MKIPNKRELRQIAPNQLSESDFQYFMKLYKDYTKEPFLVNHTTFSSDIVLRFRKTFYKNDC